LHPGRTCIGIKGASKRKNCPQHPEALYEEKWLLENSQSPRAFPRNLSVVRRQARKGGVVPTFAGFVNAAVACCRAGGSWFMKEKEIGRRVLVMGKVCKRLTSRIPRSDSRCRVVIKRQRGVDSLAKLCRKESTSTTHCGTRAHWRT